MTLSDYAIAGMNPLTLQTSSSFDEEAAQAFQNVSDLIVQTLKQAKPSLNIDQDNGWDHVVKIRAFIVGLSNIREQAREQMVCNIKRWCPNHQPLFTMVGVESLPFPEHHVEIEADVLLN
jgi:enamine deaminase RidA (YjgF/YER057c/UK114 family)